MLQSPESTDINEVKIGVRKLVVWPYACKVISENLLLLAYIFAAWSRLNKMGKIGLLGNHVAIQSHPESNWQSTGKLGKSDYWVIGLSRCTSLGQIWGVKNRAKL